MTNFAQTMFQRVPKAQVISATLDRHIVLLNIITTILVIGFVLVYIGQANGAIAKGYAIRDLENKIETLTFENQQLEVASQTAQSLDNVTKAVKMLGLVEAEQPTYVNTDTPSYALAD